jgi:predicted RNA-binding protein
VNAPRYWVLVASRDHIRHGVAQGIAQANHGQPGPLRRLQPGDRLVLYAPKLVHGQPASCQCFVALGEVEPEPVFQVQVTPDFAPFRRRVRYQPVSEVPIQPLLAQLSFIADKAHWGYRFRVGCFAIPAADFTLIQAAMTAHSYGG